MIYHYHYKYYLMILHANFGSSHLFGLASRTKIRKVVVHTDCRTVNG